MNSCSETEAAIFPMQTKLSDNLSFHRIGEDLKKQAYHKDKSKK